MRRKISSLGILLKRRWKLVTLFLVIAAIGGSVLYRRSQAAQIELTWVSPEQQTLVKTLEVSGVVDAKEKARMRFIAGGKVVYLGAEEGSWVKKGQTIATIDQATLQKQLEQDLNLFMQERLDWDKLTTYDQSSGPVNRPQEYTRQKEQLDLNNEVLDVEIRNIAIRNTVLSAPFAGILTAAPTTTTGVTILSTDFFEVVNPETLIFRAEVDEADIGSVSLGQNAEIELDAYPDEAIQTNAAYIAYTSSQTSTGTIFLVEFPLNSTNLSKYRIGMNGDIAIELKRVPNALVIPLNATRQRDGKTYVDVRTGETTYQEREIEVGTETDELIEVTGGLTERDQILLPE